MTTTVIWRPEALTARLRAATRPAASEWARLAAARAPSRRVAASMFTTGAGDTFSVGARHPLGAMFEQGVGPHEIAPTGERRVLRLADGRYVTGSVRHPGMRARPFLRPLLPAWAGIWRRWGARAI